jgi:hypothetical protein
MANGSRRLQQPYEFVHAKTGLANDASEGAAVEFIVIWYHDAGRGIITI